jgi:mycobactin peptide synthetase MbtF
LVTREPGVVNAADLLTEVELSDATDTELASAITRSARAVTEEIDPRAGAMMRAVLFSGAARGPVLLITAHHLAVDVVSWHIMLGDIAEAWRSVKSGVNAPERLNERLPEFTSYRRWSELMWERAATPQVQAQREYWIAQVRDPDPALGARHPDPARDTWSTLRVTPAVTPAAVTERVLATLVRDRGMREFLLSATAMTIASWRRERGQDASSGALVALEGHGRADSALDTDTTNTVGWFTTAFPVRLGAGAAAVDIDLAEADPGAARALLDSVTTHVGAIPNVGLDYGLLRYVERVPELRCAAEPQIQFGYLGRLDLSGATDEPWSLLAGPHLDALPIDPEPDLPLRFALNISVLVGATAEGPQLITNWRWSDALFQQSDIDLLTDFWQRGIAVLAGG